MNRSPILFRVDGTKQSGWESLWRSLIYAAALQRRRRPTYFLSQLDPASLALNVKRVGNEWLAAESPAGTPKDLADTVRQVRRLQPAAVIVDAFVAGEDYLRELRTTGTTVVSVDHHAAMDFPSRLIVNPLLAPSRESYTFTRGTQVLLGQRYALIRPEVRRVRPLRAQEPPPPFRALVALGDDDPNDQAIELAKVLANCPKVNRVDVAVRSHHPSLDGLKDLAAQNPDQLEIVTETPETMARLARCHFALTAGNAWSLELASIGVPQFVIVQGECYWPTAQRLEEEGAAICLGWHANVSAGTIRQAVQNLLSDPQERQAMARCGRKLIDGRGPDRLVTALEVLLHNIRPVTRPAVAA
jgi:spore coat polysaccharide biosynthesis predicted glycosyltransferase SpsG